MSAISTLSAYLPSVAVPPVSEPNDGSSPPPARQGGDSAVDVTTEAARPARSDAQALNAGREPVAAQPVQVEEGGPPAAAARLDAEGATTSPPPGPESPMEVFRCGCNLCRGLWMDDCDRTPSPQQIAEGDGYVHPGQEDLTSQERRQVSRLKKREAEIRAHEHAHSVAGGVHVHGRASYQYVVGPDGERYPVHGEVDISASAVPGNPRATIAKAQAIRRAALAPANPSAADRRAATAASRMELQARRELAGERRVAHEDRMMRARQSGQAAAARGIARAHGLLIVPGEDEARSVSVDQFGELFIGPSFSEAIRGMQRMLSSLPAGGNAGTSALHSHPTVDVVV